jgi:adenylate kinase
MNKVVDHTGHAFPVASALLLGPTGVGKSPLGDVIAKNGLFHKICHHLDFGSELRCAVSDEQRAVAFTPDELDFMHGVLEQGLLLENERFPLAQKIVSLFLDRNRFSQRDMLILNGLPRHAGQAQDIARITNILALIVLDCSADGVFSRIRDNVGGDRTGRADDNRDLIEIKLRIFRERTAPLIDYYEKIGCRIYRLGVTTTMTPAEAYNTLSALAAGDPPISLITEPPER